MAQRRSAMSSFAAAEELSVNRGEHERFFGLGFGPRVGDEQQLFITEELGLQRNIGLRRGGSFPECLAGERIDADDWRPRWNATPMLLIGPVE